MEFINRQNKDSKKTEKETKQEAIAMNVLVEKQYLEELQKWAELGKRSEVNQKRQEQLQQQNYRLRQENYALRTEQMQYQEAYRKRIVQEQELRKQAEFKLEVKKREATEIITQSSPKQPQLPEIKGTADNKMKIQRELSKCSKAIREIQHMIKETYQFEPCHQLCDLLVNIRQNVYSEMESIQEDMECVIEAFGIKEYHAVPGNAFDPKYHEQVYSSLGDAKGRKIKEVFSSGFEMDGEIVMKAQVSVEGGRNRRSK